MRRRSCAGAHPGHRGRLLEVVDEQGDPATPRLLVAVVTELESRPEVEYAVPNEIVDTQSSGDNVY